VLLKKSSGQAGNPWNANFLSMFHMTNDSGLFRTSNELIAEGFVLSGNHFRKDDQLFLPLYEAKMIHQFDHRFGTYDGQTQAQANQGKLPELDDSQHADPDFLPLPSYWVSQKEVALRTSERWGRGWFLGWRDITGAVVMRTVIATIIPRDGVANSYPLMLSPLAGPYCACLMAALNSFVLDYVARFKVGGTHLNLFIFEQLPVAAPPIYESAAPWSQSQLLGDWIRNRVLELTYTSWDLEPFARELSFEGPPFIWSPARRSSIRSELDAGFFHLYGIGRKDVEYVMDSFRIVRERDEARFNEYRTKRLILEAYDAMGEAIEGGEEYQSPIQPVPADSSLTHPSRTPRGSNAVGPRP
jgi:hypothetical protein